MKTKKAVETHNAIVNAAEKLFMKKSVTKVTVSEITKLAGVAKGTFYVYFESKDELVWHFIEHNLSIFSDRKIYMQFGYEITDIENIVDYIVKYMDSHKAFLKLMHNVRFYNFLGKKNLESKFTDNLVGALYLWLERGKQLGKLNIDNVDFLAQYITLSIHLMLDLIICEEINYNLQDFAKNIKPLLVKLVK